MGEEHLAHELAPTANAGLLEHALEMLLHRVRRDEKGIGDLGGGISAQDQAGDVLFALAQPVDRHQERGEPCRTGRLDDYRGAPCPVGDKGGPVQHDPAAGARQYARKRDLPWCILAFRCPRSPGGDRDHRRGQLALRLSATGQLRQPALDAGRQRLEAQVPGQHNESGDSCRHAYV